MKKNLLVLFLLAGGFAGFSQGVSFGVKAGVNLANQKYSDGNFNFSPDAKIDFVGGVYLTAMLSEKFGIQPEILYSGQGAKFDFGGPTQTLNVAYLNIPVLFRWQIIPMLNLHAGPQIGVLLNAKVDGDDAKDAFKSSDFGFAVGAGVDLPMGLNFGLRYNGSLTNVGKPDPDDQDDNSKIKNQVWQLTVGFKLFGK